MKKQTIVVLIVIAIAVGIYFYFNSEQITSTLITTVMPKTRGYINNNPGNIRHDGVIWKGEIQSTDPDFKQFQSIEYGYRAIFVNLRSYINAGINTISSMINRWAPPSENNTTAYIQSVSNDTGVDPNQPITVANVDVMKGIAKAISKVENGVPAIPSQVDDGFTLFLNS